MKTKKQTAARVADPELISQLKQAIGSIHTAQSQFEQVVDPMLIDCYIYELNAAQLRYQFLLKSIKKQDICICRCVNLHFALGYCVSFYKSRLCAVWHRGKRHRLKAAFCRCKVYPCRNNGAFHFFSQEQALA